MQPTILDRLLAISSLLHKDTQRSFAGTTLTEPRVHLLWVLIHNGPSPQNRLAEALSTTPRNISALVDGLEATGYVRREPNPGDRRAVLVTLTDEASRMMRRMGEEHARLSELLLQAVDPHDREAFEHGLDAALARLSKLVSSEEVTYRDVEGKDK